MIRKNLVPLLAALAAAVPAAIPSGVPAVSPSAALAVYCAPGVECDDNPSCEGCPPEHKPMPCEKYGFLNSKTCNYPLYDKPRPGDGG